MGYLLLFEWLKSVTVFDQHICLSTQDSSKCDATAAAAAAADDKVMRWSWLEDDMAIAQRPAAPTTTDDPRHPTRHVSLGVRTDID